MATSLNLYKYEEFEVEESFEMNDIMDYDMSWIIPKKLIVFRSPSNFTCDIALKPVEYIDFFRNH